MTDESIAKDVFDSHYDIAERKCAKEVALLRRLKTLRAVADAAAQMELSLRDMEECAVSLDGWTALKELKLGLLSDRRVAFAKAVESLEREDAGS